MTLAERYTIPAKKHAHRDSTVDSEFRNAFQTLRKIHLGPFRFFYDENTGALFLQVQDKTNPGNYISIMEIDSQTGNVSITGSVTGSATLPDVGKM